MRPPNNGARHTQDANRLAAGQKACLPAAHRPCPAPPTRPAVLQTKATPAAPPVYRPANPSKAAQPKAAGIALKRQPPAAPPAYRPQPTPHVLQAKPALPPVNIPRGRAAAVQPPAAPGALTPKRPATPPTFRPQPVPKVLQQKKALPSPPTANAGRAPALPRVLQAKMAGGTRSAGDHAPAPRHTAPAGARVSPPTNPPPRAAGRAPVIQRYPVGIATTTAGDRVTTTSGRPSAKSNKPAITEIVANIFTKGPLNEYEDLLYKLGSKQKAFDAIWNNNFLSTNDAAICHKMAIDEVEDYVVGYANKVLAGANTSKMDSHMEDWVKSLTAGNKTIQSTALAYLQGIKTATGGGPFANAASTAQQHCDDLIYTIDGSATNLYIGASRTNSSIQVHFDAHYDVSDPTNTSAVNATPYSTGIYNAQHTVGPTLGFVPHSPERATDKSGQWVKTSSVPNIGWVVIDNTGGKKI